MSIDRRRFLQGLANAGASSLFMSGVLRSAAAQQSLLPDALTGGTRHLQATTVLALDNVHVRIELSRTGLITSITSRHTQKEYLAKDRPSAVLSLHQRGVAIFPSAAKYDSARKIVTIDYPNGAVASVAVIQHDAYFRFQLVKLHRRGAVDNIIWGPVHTTISKTIGDILGVVQDDEYAIGMLALNDNTTQGPPVDGDLGQLHYYIHSPDPVKYPVPRNFKEGEVFPLGGDGSSDVAFSSRAQEYYQMGFEEGAILEPGSGSALTYHSRDRRKSHTIFYTLLPGLATAQPRHQTVDPVNVDFIGSSLALYACPNDLGLSVIEKIVLNEGLPHPTVDGIWIKDPRSLQPDIFWNGPHDRLIEYADALGLKNVQDDGMGEFYLDPSNHWDGKLVDFSDGRRLTIREFTDETRQHGIRYGLHTLTTFIQAKSSDVHPIPNVHLQTVLRTKLASPVSATDAAIRVTDPSFLAETGTWHDNKTNVLRIGTELLTYDSITRSPPWILRNIKRGQYGTNASAHAAGDELVKLQINCYHGFIPDMTLLETYADYYAQRLVDLGMQYVDFDGLESFMYQGQGDYAFKRFFRRLFDSYGRLSGGKYLRVNGSTITEGAWHYMSESSIGGGNRMFDPVANRWGIEGKDIRYLWGSSYFPISFGVQGFQADWSVYDVENLQAKSIGWNAAYLLGLDQDTVENCGNKEEIFKAFRIWENARRAGVFTSQVRKELSDLTLKFHLEQTGEHSFFLSPVKEIVLTAKADNLAHRLEINNLFQTQSLQFILRIDAPGHERVGGISITLPDNQQFELTHPMQSGDFVVFTGSAAYLADRFSKKIADLRLERAAMLPGGYSTITVRAQETSAPARSYCRLTVWSVGSAKELGRSLPSSMADTVFGSRHEMVEATMRQSSRNPAQTKEVNEQALG